MCRYRENPMDDHAQVGQFQGNQGFKFPRFDIELRDRQCRFLKSSIRWKYLNEVKQCAGILWKLQTSSTAMKVGTA